LFNALSVPALAGGAYDCPRCDAASAAVAKLGPAQLARALFSAPDGGEVDGFVQSAASDRLAALPVRRGGAGLPPPLCSRSCTSRVGLSEHDALSDAQLELLPSTDACQRETARALARVLCDAPEGGLTEVLPQVLAAFDAHLFDWLALDALCKQSSELLPA